MSLVCIDRDENSQTFSIRKIYPTKKETHHYDFPIQISFKYENVNCHEIFISDQILLKLECDVNEYRYFPCVGTKHIKAKSKRSFGSVNSTLLST